MLRFTRVAALYDIHGNLPALEAVLADVARIGVDAIIVGGDVVPGPMSAESIARLSETAVPVHCVRGNGEVAVLEELAGRRSAAPDHHRYTVHWSGLALSAEQRRSVASWPKTLRVEIRGLGEVLFCHATPRNENEIFTVRTTEARLRPAFAQANAPLIVCGHTHMPFDRTFKGMRVVNAGSVGMPFGRTGADWLLLGPGVEPRHTDYDLTAAADRVRQTAYPQRIDFAQRTILQPPSAQDMLAAFSRSELK